MHFDSNPFFGWTIFCDDIRAEIGAKFSYMGCYSGLMVIHGELPFLLPRLGIGITYYERIGQMKGQVSFNVYFPWETNPVATGPIPVDEVRSRQIDDPEALYNRFDINIVANPLQITSLGLVKAELVIDGTPYLWGRLRIKQLKGVEANQPPTS